ncbi:MAG TPA: hypothetical protein VKU80_16070 [Planctomycetota bacterium]|nr:hypothetical protein [Planctomycetota bacterium]
MSSERDTRGVGFTIVEILVAILAVVVVILVLLPGMLNVGHRYNGERSSSTTLKTLTSAEADFRANDRDWNRINDFWTADVKGLYTMTSAAVRGAEANSTVDPAIKLIELSVASADADGTFYAAGGENLPLSSFAIPSAKGGYWFAALTADLSTGQIYRQDTGGKIPMGNCHHESIFGFVAYPDSQAAGKYIYLVNQNNTIFRSNLPLRSWNHAINPPGLSTVPAGCIDWPADETLKSYWAKVD